MLRQCGITKLKPKPKMDLYSKEKKTRKHAQQAVLAFGIGFLHVTYLKSLLFYFLLMWNRKISHYHTTIQIIISDKNNKKLINYP